jgi:anti-sigma B factor antagonist
MDLVLHAHDHAEATVLLVAGELDMATAPRLRTRVVQLVTAGEAPLVVDLGGVTLLDSIGLGVLVGAAARAESLGRRLRIVCPAGRTRDLLVRTRLDTVLPLADDLASALDDLGGPRG